MAERIRMKELLGDLATAVDEAIDTANTIVGRLEIFKAALAERTPAGIAGRYERAQGLLDAATATLTDLRHVRETRIDDPMTGLEAWDIDDAEDLERDIESAEDAEANEDDRRYHEAKDEGRAK